MKTTLRTYITVATFATGLVHQLEGKGLFGLGREVNHPPETNATTSMRWGGKKGGGLESLPRLSRDVFSTKCKTGRCGTGLCTITSVCRLSRTFAIRIAQPENSPPATDSTRSRLGIAGVDECEGTERDQAVVETSTSRGPLTPKLLNAIYRGVGLCRRPNSERQTRTARSVAPRQGPRKPAGVLGGRGLVSKAEIGGYMSAHRNEKINELKPTSTAYSMVSSCSVMIRKCRTGVGRLYETITTAYTRPNFKRGT